MNTNIYKKENKGLWRLPILSVVLLISIIFAASNAQAELVITPTVTNVACAGDQSGSIFISVSGGSGVYTYLWSNFATTQNLPHVFAGTYTVTVTDVGGGTATSSSTVTQPLNLPQFAATIDNVSCFGQCDGEITVTPNGGTPGYTYHWQDGTTQQNLSNVCAGLYFLTVTDANGCRAISNNFVAQPPAPLVVIPTPNIVPCGNASGGSITLSTSGGVGILSFLWNTGATTHDLINVPAGTYTVVVHDTWPCYVTTSATIQASPAISVNKTVTHVKCAGDQSGSISITVIGGVAPFSYHWSNSVTTQNLGPVFAGTYSVTVTDANGCTGVTSATVTQPLNLPQFAATITNVACYGNCNGAITVTPNGGTPGYTYHWQDGTTLQNLNNVCAGLYFLTVTDANGCRAISNNFVAQPSAPLSVIPAVVNIQCFGGAGSILLSVSGGTTAYSYKWNTGATVKNLISQNAGSYTVTVTDANGCTNISGATITQPTAITVQKKVTNVTCFGNQNGAINITITGGGILFTYLWNNNATTQNISSLSPGTYTGTFTDNSGCPAVASATVTQPTALSVVTKVTNITCNSTAGGAINTTVSGGTSPYKFKWSNGATTQNITGLGAGTYTLTVTDAGTCPKVTSATVSGGGGGGLTCNIVAVPCSNTYTGGVPTTIYIGYGPQSVTLNSSVSPNGVYNYTWTPSAGLSCNHCADPVFTPTKAGNFTFTVTITNNSGCSSTCEITICVLDIRSNYGCGWGNGWYGPVAQNDVSPVGINTDGGFWGGGCGNHCDYDLDAYVYVCHRSGHSGCYTWQNVIVRGCNVDNYIPCYPHDHLGKCDQDCSDNDPKEGEDFDAILDGSFKVDVYPNPFNTNVTVNVETTLDETLWIELYDMTGRSVKRINNVMPFQAVQFGDDLPGGFYVMHVHQGDRIETVKIIKNK